MEIKGYLSNNKKVIVTIENNRITKVEQTTDNVPEQYIIPGFIETHSHGGYDFDFIHADLEGAKRFLNKLAYREGTTSILGTTITTDKEKVEAAINSHKELIDVPINGTTLLGYHIEGPFINPLQKGAHPADKMLEPIYGNIVGYLGDNYEYAKLFTIAPELSDENTLVELDEDGKTIFVGHSMAERNDVEGTTIRGVTHFNNAMVKYKDEGSLAEFALSSDEIYIEFINDGIHNPIELAKKIYELKPKDKLLLVTDSLHIKGLEDGTYPGPNQDIIKRDGAAWTPEGILNGSVYTQIQAFRDWVNKVGATLEEAEWATSRNVATLFNLNKGRIKEGYDADIVILDKDLNLKQTIVHGDVIKNNENI